MKFERGRKPKELDLEAEHKMHVQRMKSLIGKSVPLSSAYTHSEQPILVSIDGDTATIRFRNGAELKNIPLRDLVNDAAYWK